MPTACSRISPPSSRASSRAEPSPTRPPSRWDYPFLHQPNFFVTGRSSLANGSLTAVAVGVSKASTDRCGQLGMTPSRVRFGARPDAVRMAEMGLVSRVSPVQTAVRNSTGDEGGPFGFGDQVADPKPPQAAVVKSHGGERCGKVGTMIPIGKVERGERKRTASDASKAA
jgi:hypothetical protein